MNKITPAQFKDAFLAEVSPRESEILEKWDFPYDYTLLMQDDVLRKVAPRLDLEYFAEYYKIDGVYSVGLDRENFPLGTFASSVSIVLEHENDIRYSHTEINKLQLFNAPLKVLITYIPGPPYDSQDAKALASVTSVKKNYLELYAKVLRKADIFEDFATLRRQLIIFGSCQKFNNVERVGWEFHSYEPSALSAMRELL